MFQSINGGHILGSWLGFRSRRKAALFIAALVVLVGCLIQQFSLVPIVKYRSNSWRFDSSKTGTKTASSPMRLPLVRRATNINVNNHHPSVDSPPPRIILGIFSTRHKESDRKLQFLIETTYLRFYRQLWPHLSSYQQSQIPYLEVCSWQEYSRQPTNDCTIIYTFVVYGDTASEFIPGNSSTIPIATFSQELPTLLLNPTHWNHVFNDTAFGDSGKSDRSVPDAKKLLQFYQYVVEDMIPVILPGASHEPTDSHTLWVMTTDARVLLYPSGLFNAQFLLEIARERSVWQDDEGRIIAIPYEHVPRLSQLSIVSSMDVTGTHSTTTSRVVANTTTSDWAAKVLHQEMPALTKILPPNSYRLLISPNSTKKKSLLNNLDVKYLDLWEQYQNELLVDAFKVDESSPTDRARSHQDQPKLLLGIFSTIDSKAEAKRRAMIRKTYLAYYNDLANSTISTNTSVNDTTTKSTSEVICSLSSFLQRRRTLATGASMLIWNDTTPTPPNDSSCTVLYTFVLGRSNLDHGAGSRTDLVEPFIRGEASNEDLVVDPVEDAIFKSQNVNIPIIREIETHQDITVLNLKENMNEGKSQSWFLFASQLEKQGADESDTWMVDYIGKADSDTLIFPDVLIEKVLARLPQVHIGGNIGIYGGGAPIVKSSESTNRLAGPYYFQGSFYFMGCDVARYITTSTKVNRLAWDVGAEDKTMANFVWNYPSPIRRISKSWLGEWFAHPVKEPYRFRNLWNKKYPHRSVEQVLSS